MTPRPTYSVRVAPRRVVSANPFRQIVTHHAPPEASIMPGNDYTGADNDAMNGSGCCGGYLIAHASEPNIYPYENPKTWVGLLKDTPKNDVLEYGKGKSETFENVPPSHPPTYAEALATRTKLGLGHHRKGGYLPFESAGVGIFEGLQSSLTMGLVGAGAYLASDYIPAPFGTIAKVGGIGIALLGIAKLFSSDGEPPVKTFSPTPPGGYKISGKFVSPLNGGKVGRDSFFGSTWSATVEVTNDGDAPVTVNLEVKSIEDAGFYGGGKKTTTGQKQVTLAPHVPTTVKIDMPLAFFSYLTATTAEVGLTIGGKYIANVKNVTIGI
jgi:hypothetical protein